MPRGAGRRIGQPGEHQMDDVVGEIMLAIGDVDLLAENPVGAVAHGFGAGLQRIEVGGCPCGSSGFIVPIHSPVTSFSRYWA